MQLCNDIPCLVVVVIGDGTTFLADASLQVRKPGHRNADASAHFIVVLFQVLVTYDKIGTELIVDAVKTIIVLKAPALHEFGELVLDDGEFIEGHAKVMVKAFARLESRILPLVPEEIGKGAVPGITSNAEFEIIVPDLRGFSRLDGWCVDVLADLPVKFVSIHGAMDKFALLVAIMTKVVDGHYHVVAAAVIGQRGFNAGPGRFQRFDENELMAM